MGAGHCFGMCGGLIGAFSAQLPYKADQNRLASQLLFLLSYNSGRIFSYALAGAIVGGSANALGQLFAIDSYLLILRIIAGVMMILMGLYIAQFWAGLMQLEKLGQYLWRYLSPFAQKLLPVTNYPQAIAAGFIWGWLPCGLVYSMLTWSVMANSALQGAGIMVAFGVGTLPALLSAGVAAKFLSHWTKKNSIKLLSGMLLILFGIQTLYIAFAQ